MELFPVSEEVSYVYVQFSVYNYQNSPQKIIIIQQITSIYVLYSHFHAKFVPLCLFILHFFTFTTLGWTIMKSKVTSNMYLGSKGIFGGYVCKYKNFNQ